MPNNKFALLVVVGFLLGQLTFLAGVVIWDKYFDR